MTLSNPLSPSWKPEISQLSKCIQISILDRYKHLFSLSDCLFPTKSNCCIYIANLKAMSHLHVWKKKILGFAARLRAFSLLNCSRTQSISSSWPSADIMVEFCLLLLAVPWLMIATTQESKREWSLCWANSRILRIMSCSEYKQILTYESPDKFNRWLFPLKMWSTIPSGKMHTVTSRVFFWI